MAGEDVAEPGATPRRRELIDDLGLLLNSLPPDVLEAVQALTDPSNLIEIVMDLGRRPEARFTDGEQTLLEREITQADLAYVVDHIGVFGEDNRAGIERTLHRISAIRNRTGKVVGLGDLALEECLLAVGEARLRSPAEVHDNLDQVGWIGQSLDGLQHVRWKRIEKQPQVVDQLASAGRRARFRHVFSCHMRLAYRRNERRFRDSHNGLLHE